MPFFVRPYPIKEEQKSIVKREMDCLVNLGIIKKGLTVYSSPVLLVKRKRQNLFRLCSDFRVLNDRLVSNLNKPCLSFSQRLHRSNR